MARVASGRTVELLEVPAGPDVLSVLPRLADALTGTGPALAPVKAGDHARIAELAAAFGVGQALGPGEDDAQDPTVLVIATSGSTGTPKGSLLPRSALVSSAAATARRLGPPGTWLLALPGQHIAGMQVLLRALATGSEPVVMDTSLPFTADRLEQAAGQLPPGERYLSLVPTQLQRALRSESAAAALRSFTAVLVGGAATPEPLLDLARLAGVPVVTSYGMSETCGGCVYDGIPLDGVRITLEQDGRVRLAGPVVGRGYRRLPGHPGFPAPGVFRTDDLGEFSGGRLKILGRIDDVIISGGIKIVPALLEAAIARVVTVAEVVVVGVPDDEWGHIAVAVVVAVRPGSPPTADEVRAACGAAGLPREQQPRALVVLDALPARGPGKPDRAAVATIAVDRLAPRASFARSADGGRGP